MVDGDPDRVVPAVPSLTAVMPMPPFRGDVRSNVVHVQFADRGDDLFERFAGNAPGWEKTRMPSRKAIRVGMERIPAAAARFRSASVSTLPNTMSGWVVAAFSKMGANIRHGPHQEAQKSTRTIPSPVTARSNVPWSVLLLPWSDQILSLGEVYPWGYQRQCGPECSPLGIPCPVGYRGCGNTAGGSTVDPDRIPHRVYEQGRVGAVRDA